MTPKGRRPSSGAPTPDDDRDANRAAPRQERPYLIARREASLAGASLGNEPVDFEALVAQLKSDPSVQFEREITPTGLAALAVTPTPLQRVVVAQLPDAKAKELAEHPDLLVEEDAPLHLAPAPEVVSDALLNPLSLLPFGATTTWTMRIQDRNGDPIGGANVVLSGRGIPGQGRTDNDGRVSITLANETDESLTSLQVMPQSNYWSLRIADPVLSSNGQVNEIVLNPLSTSFQGFPDTQMLGWGEQAMRLSQLDPRFTGAGAKVAVIDSGAANTHPDLTHITRGKDCTVAPPTDAGWENDGQAHGSHCSGVVAGSNDKAGIRGFAPAADVRACRVLPGGRFSSLLDALDYCIEQQMDVVNMSLGTETKSEAIQLKLRQAKEAGVACIVAAGNTGGSVLFPGTSPDVLTVAAVGKLAEFPPDSTHALRVPTNGPIDKGFFSATFSCHGPEVDLCGPGVAIISSVPPDGFAAWDGTSMAAPHIAGLAALLVAHHPDFAQDFQERNSARVDRLFQILKESSTPLNLGDPGRTGVGMPDAVSALTARSRGSAPAATSSVDAMTSLLEQLRGELVAAGILQR
jgi:subtilisin family serine protease